MRAISICSAVVLLVSFVGCEAPKPAGTSEPTVVEVPAVPEAVPVPAAPPVMVQEKAQPGVGKRGGDIPAEPTAGAILTTPTNVYFRAQEQVVFNIQIPEALKLFKATEGRAPDSEEEFFAKIIKANNINLPELPAGHAYKYDVAQEQLMVEHPQ